MRKVIAVVVVAIALAVALVWKLQHRSSSKSSESGGTTARDGMHVGRAAAAATPASLSGRVTRRSDGAGIANAVVAIVTSDLMAQMISEAPPIIVVTDATGAWTASKVTPGAYLVTATATGYLPAQLPKLWLASGEQHAGVVIALDAGGTLLHGTVTDVGGGPIGGAHVAVSRSSSIDLTHAELAAVTAPDGTYQLTLADGDYDVSVTHDDYTRGDHDAQIAGKPVVVDFVLTPGGVVRGQVIARDTGKPVPNAMVSASSHRRFEGGGTRATADADGAFVVRGLHSGVISISASGRGYASATPTTVQIGIGEQLEGIRVLVDHALAIRGTVVKKGQHTGIPGIRVGVFSITGGRQSMAPDPSDADGKFEIVGVRPGSYMVYAFGENTVPEIGKAVQIVDKDVNGVEIEMATGVTISGRVEPPQVASIGISLAGEVGLANMLEAMKTFAVHADSDASGAFVLHNVPTGAFKLTARTTDGHQGSTPIVVADADQNGLVVTLEARASVSGRVVDTNNAPVAGIQLDAEPTEERRATMEFSGGGSTGATSAADGTFKLVGLDAGKYRIVASVDRTDRVMNELDKGKKKDPVEVELAAGVEHTGVVVTVEARDGVIRGEVIGSDRQPAADVWVTARRERAKSTTTTVTVGGGDGDSDSDDDGELFAWTSPPVLTGADGKFSIDRLKHGTYTVIADGPRGGSRAEKAAVKTGDSITIELQPLGTLTGHVARGGAPVTEYDLTCRGPAGPIDREVAAADGAYSLEHLAPGPYDCKASSDAGTASGKVDVPAGAAQLELVLIPWASLTGVVISMFSGAPVPGLTAITSMDGKAMVAAMTGTGPVTDATGRFDVEQVGAGSGSLMVMSASGFTPLATRPYTATQGQRVDLGTIKVVPPRQGDAGTLGMTVAAVDNVLSVTAVKAGGPAEAAGVQVGDKITTIDGQAVSVLGAQQSAQFLSSGQIGVGEVVQLGLDRGGATVQATITSIKW